MSKAGESLEEAIRAYWNEHIHDLEIATEPVGTAGFFQELEAYRFDKLDYLPELVRFDTYAGKRVLEVGCGVGIDLARFAQAGAIVTGVDLAERSIQLARRNFKHQGLAGELEVMNGEALEFPEGRFDLVYAHGVLQYTMDPPRMVEEIHRVLEGQGRAILGVYNRRSWLHWISRLTGVALEHEDAPVMRKWSRDELVSLLEPFGQVEIVPERFPVRTELHSGWKSVAYNELFVRLFQMLPRSWVRPMGWHLIAFARKGMGS